MSKHSVPLPSGEVRRIRDNLGWTRRRLAEPMGVSDSTVKHWESGARGCSGPAAVLLRLLEADPGIVDKLNTGKAGALAPVLAKLDQLLERQ